MLQWKVGAKVSSLSLRYSTHLYLSKCHESPGIDIATLQRMFKWTSFGSQNDPVQWARFASPSLFFALEGNQPRASGSLLIVGPVTARAGLYSIGQGASVLWVPRSHERTSSCCGQTTCQDEPLGSGGAGMNTRIGQNHPLAHPAASRDVEKPSKRCCQKFPRWRQMRAYHSYQIMGLHLSSKGLDDQDYWGLLQPKAQDRWHWVDFCKS